jgi:mRNA-degrading endonuclease YafQ of YafQ-DinJ toxin-antitoxin module
MEFIFSNRFKKDYQKLSPEAKIILQNKLQIMAENPKHPSLRTKKIRGNEEIFECSINMNIRMTWEYRDNKILLRAIGEHDSTLKKP